VGYSVCLEDVEGELCSLEVLEMTEAMRRVLRRVLLCMLDDVEGALFFLLEELDVPVVMRCVLFCMLDDVEGALFLLDELDVPEVIRRGLRCMLRGRGG